MATDETNRSGLSNDRKKELLTTDVTNRRSQRRREEETHGDRRDERERSQLRREEGNLRDNHARNYRRIFYLYVHNGARPVDPFVAGVMSLKDWDVCAVCQEIGSVWMQGHAHICALAVAVIRGLFGNSRLLTE